MGDSGSKVFDSLFPFQFRESAEVEKTLTGADLMSRAEASTFGPKKKPSKPVGRPPGSGAKKPQAVNLRFPTLDAELQHWRASEWLKERLFESGGDTTLLLASVPSAREGSPEHVLLPGSVLNVKFPDGKHILLMLYDPVRFFVESVE